MPSEGEVAVVIRNLHGSHTPLFLPQLAFDSAVKTLVQRYKPPLQKSVQLILSHLNKIIEKCAKSVSSKNK